MVRAVCVASAWVLALSVWLFPVTAARAQSRPLAVHVLDAGAGDATWLATPDMSTVVVLECGTTGYGRQFLSLLLASGVQRIDVLAPTSARPEVVGGCTDLLQGLPVGQLWLTGQTDPSTSWRTFQASYQADGLQPNYWRAGADPVAWGDLSAQAFNPGAVVPGAPLDPFDDSLALFLQYGAARMVVLGGLRANGQSAAVQAGLPQASVLKTAVHDDRQLPSATLLNAVTPQVLVLSAPSNASGLASIGVPQVCSTASGAVAINLPADGTPPLAVNVRNQACSLNANA
ncbi:MAG: hypothetical protein JO020_22640 [Chloroflexi bacterium]|nr:hypothetical protein [Chloroflexota bacterium]MBV9896971.1 hypothetical protein [Chloroflexota bacterium]